MAEVYRINGETLTVLSDLVRSLSGSTDSLSPGDMATALDEAWNETQNCLSALEEKGVDISSYTGIADLPGLIGAISGGDIETFTMTLAGSIDQWNAEYGEKGYDTVMVVLQDDIIEAGKYGRILAFSTRVDETWYYCDFMLTNDDATSVSARTGISTVGNTNADKTAILTKYNHLECYATDSGSHGLTIGCTYKFFLFARGII